MPNEITQFGDLAFPRYDVIEHKQLVEAERFVTHLESIYDITDFQTSRQKFLIHVGLFGSDAHDITTMTDDVDFTLIYETFRQAFNAEADQRLDLETFLDYLSSNWSFGLDVARRLTLNEDRYVERKGTESQPFYRTDPATVSVSDFPAPAIDLVPEDLAFGDNYLHPSLFVNANGLNVNHIRVPFTTLFSVVPDQSEKSLTFFSFIDPKSEFHQFVIGCSTSSIYIEKTSVSLSNVVTQAKVEKSVSGSHPCRTILITRTKDAITVYDWDENNSDIVSIVQAGDYSHGTDSFRITDAASSRINFSRSGPRCTHLAVWEETLSQAHRLELLRSGYRT